jgi:ABC-type uncharacterized transport system substrate-binding protein
MRRRQFITLLGGAAVAWPLAARAQQARKLPTIGFIGANTAVVESKWTAAFVQRLAQLGWTEGRTIEIEYRWADGHNERNADLVADLIQHKVDIIVGHGAAVPAAKRATSTIPIVFTLSGDPVGIGLVDSLARPGGNVTGLSILQIDTAGKRLEIMREVLPAVHRLMVVGNASFSQTRREIGRGRGGVGRTWA